MIFNDFLMKIAAAGALTIRKSMKSIGILIKFHKNHENINKNATGIKLQGFCCFHDISS